MKTDNYILFCESPLEINKVDPDFEEEFNCAKQEGFQTILFNFDNLTVDNDIQKSTRRIKHQDSLTNVVYRGWMLTPKQYAILYAELISKNFKLINTPTEYQNCHYLPDSLKYIEKYTPKTVFEKLNEKNDLQSLIDKSRSFDNKPIIIKDYVKSEKHDWETACFVENASDSAKLTQTINNFIVLRDKFLNEGIVIREFIDLKALTVHSKSGMPLTEEYRLFFFNKKLLGVYDYWEEGEYELSRPDTKMFEEIANNIESKFFSMDIARQRNGELIIIELGDGQVAGLPEKLDRSDFYRQLKDCSC